MFDRLRTTAWIVAGTLFYGAGLLILAFAGPDPFMREPLPPPDDDDDSASRKAAEAAIRSVRLWSERAANKRRG